MRTTTPFCATLAVLLGLAPPALFGSEPEKPGPFEGRLAAAIAPLGFDSQAVADATLRIAGKRPLPVGTCLDAGDQAAGENDPLMGRTKDQRRLKGYQAFGSDQRWRTASDVEQAFTSDGRWTASNAALLTRTPLCGLRIFSFVGFTTMAF